LVGRAAVKLSDLEQEAFIDFSPRWGKPLIATAKADIEADGHPSLLR
jgi:hypothetical protein